MSFNIIQGSSFFGKRSAVRQSRLQAVRYFETIKKIPWNDIKGYTVIAVKKLNQGEFDNFANILYDKKDINWGEREE